VVDPEPMRGDGEQLVGPEYGSLFSPTGKKGEYIWTNFHANNNVMDRCADRGDEVTFFFLRRAERDKNRRILIASLSHSHTRSSSACSIEAPPYACRENRSLAFFRSKLCEPAQAVWQPKGQNSLDRIDTITKPKDILVST
jgi:hypothetical protein